MADYNTTSTTTTVPTGSSPGDPSTVIGVQSQAPLTVEELLRILVSGGNFYDLLAGRNSMVGALNQPLPIRVASLPNTTDLPAIEERDATGHVTVTHPTAPLPSTPVNANAQDLLTALYSMNTDDLIRLQRKLWDGGFYQGQKTSGVTQSLQPTWGIADDATRIAYMGAMQLALARPDQTLDEVIGSREGPTLADRSAARRSATEEQLAVLRADKSASVTSAASLNSIIDKLGPAMLGHAVSDDERAKMITAVQGDQTSQAQMKFDAAAKAAQIKAQGTSDADVDRFLDLVQSNNGIGSVLGFDPKQWSSWATKVGLAADTPLNPENARKVAKELVLDYYSQFHNWRDVATAFFAGPGSYYQRPATVDEPGRRPFSESTGVAPQDPIQVHADKVANGMTAGTTPFPSDASLTLGGKVTPVQTIDPASELEQRLKADNPVEYFGHETATRYDQFMKMLGGV